MNAPAQIKPLPAVRVDETAIEETYRRSISIHCPQQDEMAMAARVDIAMMRDNAAKGIARAGDSASVLLAEVSRIATLFVFAPCRPSELLRIRSALNLTIEAARALERVVPDGR